MIAVNVFGLTRGVSSTGGDLASLANYTTISTLNNWQSQHISLQRPFADTATQLYAYLPVPNQTLDGQQSVPQPAEILVMNPEPNAVVLGTLVMSFDGDALLRLLPALYRIRDAQVIQGQTLLNPTEAAQLATLQANAATLTADQQIQLDRLIAKAGRGPLQSLLMLIAEQIAAVEDDLEQLYDNQFIETCADWVIPYIGDFIGYQSVNGVAQAAASPRAEVANTISLRRRKGTSGAGAVGARRDRLGRARRGIFQASGRHPIHEPFAALLPLRSRPAPLAAARLHGHGLRCHLPHGGRPPYRGRPGALQHTERGHLPLVPERL